MQCELFFLLWVDLKLLWNVIETCVEYDSFLSFFFNKITTVFHDRNMGGNDKYQIKINPQTQLSGSEQSTRWCHQTACQTPAQKQMPLNTEKQICVSCACSWHYEFQRSVGKIVSRWRKFISCSYLEQMASKHTGQAIKCTLSSIILKNVPHVAFKRVSMLILFTTNQK